MQASSSLMCKIPAFGAVRDANFPSAGAVDLHMPSTWIKEPGSRQVGASTCLSFHPGENLTLLQVAMGHGCNLRFLSPSSFPEKAQGHGEHHLFSPAPPLPSAGEKPNGSLCGAKAAAARRAQRQTWIPGSGSGTQLRLSALPAESLEPEQRAGSPPALQCQAGTSSCSGHAAFLRQGWDVLLPFPAGQSGWHGPG